jgi:hypothetical protein
MRRELDNVKTDLARSRKSVTDLERTLQETREMLRVRDAEIARLQSELEKVTRHRDQLKAERRKSMGSDSAHSRGSFDGSVISSTTHASSRAAVKRSGSTASTASRAKSPSRNRSHSSLSVSTADPAEEEENRARLRSLEAFLTKVDRWSGAQVIQAVHDLNAEILQFAASATEACSFVRPLRKPPRATQAIQDSTARLGPLLVRVLLSRDHSQDPILVQLALQGVISTCVARAMSTFCLGFQTKSNALLAQIYGHMSVTGMILCRICRKSLTLTRICIIEPQPMSSRWRALTHRQIHLLHPDLEDFAVSDLSETILRWATDIFVVSGCANPEQSGSSRTQFGPQVRRIAQAVFKLTQVTREDIMSTAFEVVAVEHGESFDSQRMEDTFVEYAPSRGAILSTTELGLRCSTRRTRAEMGGVGDDVVFERRILTRPKVALESVFDVLDPK